MIVDNFNIFADNIEWDTIDTNNGDFVFIQILRRNKDDNKKTDAPPSKLPVYRVRSKEMFLARMEEIKKVCRENNARAYIHYSVRDGKKYAQIFVKRALEHFIDGSYSAMSHLPEVAAGLHCPKHVSYLVDVDIKDDAVLAKMCDAIENDCRYPNGYDGKNVICLVPTRHGTHIITKPFNTKKFEDMFFQYRDDSKNPLVHTNNPTFLYYEGDE